MSDDEQRVYHVAKDWKGVARNGWTNCSLGTAVGLSEYRRISDYIDGRCSYCGIKHDHDAYQCPCCGAPI